MSCRRHPLRALAAVFALLVASVFFASSAAAHPLRTARVDVFALSTNEARLTASAQAQLPDLDVLVLRGEGCAFDKARSSGTLRCSGGLAEVSLRVRLSIGDEQADLVLATLHGFPTAPTSVLLTKSSPSLTLPAAVSDEPLLGVLLRYGRLGIEHVSSGIDHVLFLLALFLQALTSADRRSVHRGRAVVGELGRTATAFTCAHSITLAATVLGALRIRPDIAEACIAASLVLVALDLDSSRRAHQGRTRVVFAGVFGLVHGLGFAGALGEAGLPAHGQVPALLAFNVGVEIGQALIFVFFGAVLLVFTRRPRWRRHVELASVYAVGGVGSALFFLRTGAMFR